MKDQREYRRHGAEWGWIKCREMVTKEAVRLFLAGEDEKAILLRNLVNNNLVIQADTMEGAPREHCEPGCDCR